MPGFYEERYWKKGIRLVAGVDEAGRGPLAGPVVAAAVILPPHCTIEGLKDSKLMRPAARESVLEIIRQKALAIAFAIVSPEEIDRINILQATLMAMSEAVGKLSLNPEFVIVDGNRLPAWEWKAEALVRGDSLAHAVSAASVVAKVERDMLMMELDAFYPAYNFKKHKGYGTQEHIEAIRKYGLSPVHRRTFCRNPETFGAQLPIPGVPA